MKTRLCLGLPLISVALLSNSALAAAPAVAPAVTMGAAPGHITGVGGVFFKSKDPKALAAWYRDVLGLNVEAWGGAILKYDAPGHPPLVVWNAFAQGSDYFAPSTRDFMLNYAVDDLDAFLARLAGKGVKPLKRDDTDPNGKFAWIVDPDGTKIELWQPKAP
jgi:catechol 2,3-dioxygenase-like lactoylglutathione lyase family enzyme